MTSFYDTLKTYDWDDVKQNIMDKSKNDAIAAINNPHRTLDDFMALISPAATPLLEDMAVEANRLPDPGKIREHDPVVHSLVRFQLLHEFLRVLRFQPR